MYQCILIDPPWPHTGGGKRGAQEHYPVLKFHEILPTIEASPLWKPAENCHLWLWVTNNFLPRGLTLMTDLGFRYVTNCVWHKDKFGIGHYLRGQHEIMLFGVRGRLPGQSKRTPTIFCAKRTKHSQKPEESYQVIEAVSPGPRAELFARRPREGWDVWGNEVESLTKPMDQRITTYTDLPSVKIKEFTEEGKALIRALESIEISDPEQVEELTELLKEVHKKTRSLDDLRKEVGKPAREAQKDINQFFRPAIDAYQRAKDLIKEKLRAYARKCEEEQEAALEQAASGDGSALAKTGEQIPLFNTRKKVIVEVTDIDLVPREYMCVDYSALKILAKKGGSAPPGINFRWSDEIVVGRR